MFEYNSDNFMDESQFGYDTISFSCINDYRKGYTDFKAIFDALKCVRKLLFTWGPQAIMFINIRIEIRRNDRLSAAQ